MDDETLMGLYLIRSQHAITETEAKYGRMCRYIVKSILNSAEDEEECINDVYLELWRTVSLVQPENLKAYIATISKNQAIKKKRYNYAEKRRQNGVVQGMSVEEYANKNDELENRLDEIMIEEYLAKFLERYDEKKRRIFIRRYCYGDSMTQISEEFIISISNVKILLFRMRRELKKYLNEEGYDLYGENKI